MQNSIQSVFNTEELKVVTSTREAAKFACENFHYLGKLPTGKLISHAVWEDNRFIGVIVYSGGGNRMIGSPYGLNHKEICELSRVALTTHRTPVSRILKYSLRLLHETNPDLKLVVSYADPYYHHIGTIYQASNWIYEGKKRNSYQYMINGELVHGKTVNDRYGTAKIDYLKEHVDKNAEMIYIEGKFKYLYPLTKSLRKQYEYLHKPYPKRGEL